MTQKTGLGTRVLQWVKTNGSKPSALPLLGSLSVGDFFIPALPTQSSVILLAILQPARAIAIVLIFALAAAIGASILSGMAWLMDDFLTQAMPGPGSAAEAHWAQLQQWLSQYGLWALFAMSLSPTPPRTLIILSLLSGIAGSLVVLTVLAGKLIWYSLVVTLVIKAPHWLIKVPVIGPRIAPLIQNQT